MGGIIFTSAEHTFKQRYLRPKRGFFTSIVRLLWSGEGLIQHHLWVGICQPSWSGVQAPDRPLNKGIFEHILQGVQYERSSHPDQKIG